MSIQIRLWSLSLSDFQEAEESLRSFAQRTEMSGYLSVLLLGPVPLPVKKHIVTVNRSVHADNKSRDQYIIQVRKRLWTLNLEAIYGRDIEIGKEFLREDFVYIWQILLRELRDLKTVGFDFKVSVNSAWGDSTWCNESVA